MKQDVNCTYIFDFLKQIMIKEKCLLYELNIKQSLYLVF